MPKLGPIRSTVMRLAPLASAIPYFLLVVTLIRVWVAPMSVDHGRWVPFAVGLMCLEFVVLHSGAFMGALAVGDVPTRRKVMAFLALAALYGLFALGFSLAIGTWSLMRIYGLLMAGRFLTVMAASSEGKVLLILRSGVGVAAYLASVFLTLFVPIPSGGISYAVLDEVYPDRGSGVWEQNPEVAIAAGVIYFTALGVFELVLAGRKGGTMVEKAAAGAGNPFEPGSGG